MAKGHGATDSSPAAPPPSLKKSNSGSQTSKNQKSILGFFQKKSTDSSLPALTRDAGSSPSTNGGATKRLAKRPATKRGSSQTLTPAPSSDAAEGFDLENVMEGGRHQINGPNALPSPITPVTRPVDGNDSRANMDDLLSFNSPSRKVVDPLFPSLYFD